MNLSSLRFIKVVLLGVLWLLAPPGSTAPADELKAAYILNFAKLTTWPDDVLGARQAPLVFCGFMSDPVLDALRALGEKNVNGRPIRVKAIRLPKENEGCHVLYFGQAQHRLAEVSSAQRRGLLLIGDTDGFIESGGAINYFLHQGKLRFEINTENARMADLVLSARLLNLARRREEGS